MIPMRAVLPNVNCACILVTFYVCLRNQFDLMTICASVDHVKLNRPLVDGKHRGETIHCGGSLSSSVSPYPSTFIIM